MRRSPLIPALFGLLSSVILALAPFAMLHAHVDPHTELIVHGGHHHEAQSDKHAHDRFDNVDVVFHHPASLAHDHSLDGHLVHCDVNVVKHDDPRSLKTAIGLRHSGLPQPPRASSTESRAERETVLIARRFYLHPPLRGPPL